MESVGSYEAKTHLPALLARVAKGEQITITRHGVPVAVLAPVSGSRKGDIHETIEAVLASRKGWKLGGGSVREMIEEGRR